jgi:DmsE family decaheme c-type cytochrome
MRQRILGLIIGATAVVLVAIATQPAGAQADPAYAEATVCLDCHQEVADGLASTPHGKGGFGELSDHGCQSCHGPALAHTEDPTDEALQPSLAGLSADRKSEMCTSCHRGEAQFFWADSTHEKRGLACTDCHSVHSFASETAQLQSAAVQDQCFSCHKDVRAETWKRSHHPIREGEISCTDCHNPHGTGNEVMLATASVNDTCYECHAEKRGPFLWEHAPVRESCLNCHTPHGSNHFKLQKTSTPFLCQECHANTRHPGTLYDATTNADGSRPSNRDFNRGCTNCHSAVHGSNHPSSPYLAH